MTNRLEKGDTAPAITLPATNDQTVKLGAPQRKGHVVFFYPKDNTSGCTTEATDFTRLKAQFDRLGFAIIGVSKDSLTSHDNFRAKHDLSVILASDPDGEACEAFGVWVEKNMYGRKYMGIERATFIITADKAVAEVWRKVRVKGHADAVLAATQALIE